jgi:hypothetical protein
MSDLVPSPETAWHLTAVPIQEEEQSYLSSRLTRLTQRILWRQALAKSPLSYVACFQHRLTRFDQPPPVTTQGLERSPDLVCHRIFRGQR